MEGGVVVEVDGEVERVGAGAVVGVGVVVVPCQL